MNAVKRNFINLFIVFIKKSGLVIKSEFGTDSIFFIEGEHYFISEKLIRYSSLRAGKQRFSPVSLTISVFLYETNFDCWLMSFAPGNFYEFLPARHLIEVNSLSNDNPIITAVRFVKKLSEFPLRGVF